MASPRPGTEGLGTQPSLTTCRPGTEHSHRQASTLSSAEGWGQTPQAPRHLQEPDLTILRDTLTLGAAGGQVGHLQFPVIRFPPLLLREVHSLIVQSQTWGPGPPKPWPLQAGLHHCPSGSFSSKKTLFSGLPLAQGSPLGPVPKNGGI